MQISQASCALDEHTKTKSAPVGLKYTLSVKITTFVLNGKTERLVLYTS